VIKMGDKIAVAAKFLFYDKVAEKRQAWVGRVTGQGSSKKKSLRKTQRSS
jgi:hypothetical protein